MNQTTHPAKPTGQPSPKDPLAVTIDYLRSLRDQGFYGKIVIEIREGEIVLLREEKTIKPTG